MASVGPMLSVGSFVALGDSFTEGVGDPYPDGTYRGWSDRFATRLAVCAPGLRYANLAIRGKVLSQVVDEQVPVAVTLAPDLVSVAAGGNDLLRPRVDPDALAATFERAVADLRAAGSQVMLFTGFDPGGFPLIRLIRGKAAAFNAQLREVARKHDCLHVDLWSMRVLADPREWCEDRLHLAPDGHRRVALRACEVAGLPVAEDWREPLAPDPVAPPRWLSARRQDVQWARTYAAPWLHRRLRGVSSGDGMAPKRPELQQLEI
ncbi:MAG TPA: SGNH/GDSL hydrolase family protein [Streptosporangiaceae bacterium]|nr:SGNH/GDSL hydrolase family protein [Streptosporangiaceae bacterium]